jgi:radical SAM superfamily enzyme YgiQ (UPF0313 family)
MEPLPVAAIAGLTGQACDVRFYDDRQDQIPYDEKTDAVLISIETYTAKRAYQIASEYRMRHVPVIMGGFHATLLPEEVERYAEAVVVGEAETIWDTVLDDLRHGTLLKRYQSAEQPSLRDIRIDRSLFKGKKYLPFRLVETGRGCTFDCEFCAIQTFFGKTHRQRPIDHVVAEISSLRASTRLFFFVDDNFAGDMESAKELLRALIPLKIRWVTQMSINAAYDEEFLDLLGRSGCKLVLIGLESLDRENLLQMKKPLNLRDGNYQAALANLHRHGINVYATFVFGYDNDTLQSFTDAVDFAIEQNMYIAAFNHLTPFPGTPIYSKLKEQKRLLYDAWWLEDRYRYNDVPFHPAGLSHREITANCVASRKRFYALPSIIKRGLSAAVRQDSYMLRNFFPINFLHTREINKRNGYPLGDEGWQGRLLEAER